MKAFFILLVIIILDGILLTNGGAWKIDRENYVSKQTLELSTPFDVRIDTEFLQSLEPADESSRTSPKGI